jgi:single-strand DNA-binding protein
MLQANVTGTIGQDAIVNNTSEYQILSFSVSASSKKDKNGQWNTTWVKCVKFYPQGKSIDLLPKLTKGSKVAVSGRIELSEWTTKTGEKKVDIQCNADYIEVLSSTFDAVPVAANSAPNPFG